MREGQRIKVIQKWTEGVGDNLPILAMGNSSDVLPPTVMNERSNKLEPCQFTFEADHTLYLGDKFESSLVVQAWKVPADRKVPLDRVVAQVPHECTEPRQVELKDQRESDDNGISSLYDWDHLWFLIIHHPGNAQRSDTYS